MSYRNDALRGLRQQELAERRNNMSGRSDCTIFDYKTWDKDWLFAYPTQRVVYIRYRWLGVFKWCLDLLIYFYLFYGIFYTFKFHVIKDTPQIYAWYKPIPTESLDPDKYAYCANDYTAFLNQDWTNRSETKSFPCAKPIGDNLFTSQSYESSTIVTHTQTYRHRIKDDGTESIEATNEYYTMGVEDLQFEFWFTFHCPRLYSEAVTNAYYNDYQNSSDAQEGYLCSFNSEPSDCKKAISVNSQPGYIRHWEENDKKILSVGEMIEATGQDKDLLDKPCPGNDGTYDEQYTSINGVNNLGYKLNAQNNNTFTFRRCGITFAASLVIEQENFLNLDIQKPTKFTFFLFVEVKKDIPRYTYEMQSYVIDPLALAVSSNVIAAWYETNYGIDQLEAGKNSRYKPSNPNSDIEDDDDIYVTNIDSVEKVELSEPSASDQLFLRYIKRGIKIEIHAVQGLSTWSYYQVILCLVSVFILKDLANVIVDWFMTTFIPVYSPLFYRAKYEFSADLGDLKNNKNLDMKEIFIKSKEKQLGQARGAFKQKLNKIQKTANKWRRDCMYLFDDVNEVFRVTKYRDPETTDILNNLTQNIIQGWSKVGHDDLAIQDKLDARDPEEEWTVSDILKYDQVRFSGITVKDVPNRFKTIVFVPSVSMKWNTKAQNFATKILETYKPKKFRYVQILGVGKRRDVKAAEVECEEEFQRSDLDSIKKGIENYEEQYPLASKFSIRPCMDVLITELKKFVDKVDPHQKGFILQNSFRDLMSLTSQMNLKKMDHFYKLLKGKNRKQNPGVDLKSIINEAYKRGVKEDRSNPTEAINFAVRELAKQALKRQKRIHKEKGMEAKARGRDML